MSSSSVRVQLVHPDGTIVRKGLRVRVAPGVGDGSAADEYVWGEITPLDGDAARDAVLSAVRGPAVRAFVRSLPVARFVPREEAEAPARHAKD